MAQSPQAACPNPSFVADRVAAAEQLAQWREFAESRHHTHVLIEVLAVQAVLCEAQGDRSAALAALTRAIGLARPGGFIRLFVDLGSTMLALLRELRDRGVAPYFVTRILAAQSRTATDRAGGDYG